MIVLFVYGDDAEALLTLARRSGFVAVAAQLAAQLPLERLLPSTDVPALTVRYGEASWDVFDQARADAMWIAMIDADRRQQTSEREQLPLFASGAV